MKRDAGKVFIALLFLSFSLSLSASDEPERLFLGVGVGSQSWLTESAQESLHSSRGGEWRGDDFAFEYSLHYFPKTIKAGMLGYGLSYRGSGYYFKPTNSSFPSEDYRYSATQTVLSVEYVYRQLATGPYLIPMVELGETLYDSYALFGDASQLLPEKSGYVGLGIKGVGGAVNSGSSFYLSLTVGQQQMELSEHRLHMMFGFMF